MIDKADYDECADPFHTSPRAEERLRDPKDPRYCGCRGNVEGKPVCPCCGGLKQPRAEEPRAELRDLDNANLALGVAITTMKRYARVERGSSAHAEIVATLTDAQELVVRLRNASSPAVGVEEVAGVIFDAIKGNALPSWDWVSKDGDPQSVHATRVCRDAAERVLSLFRGGPHAR